MSTDIQKMLADLQKTLADLQKTLADLQKMSTDIQKMLAERSDIKIFAFVIYFIKYDGTDYILVSILIDLFTII